MHKQKYCFLTINQSINYKIMAKVYEFVANGFEEIEGLAPVDILRRGGVDIKTVSITGSDFVETSHGVIIKADMKFERCRHVIVARRAARKHEPE